MKKDCFRSRRERKRYNRERARRLREPTTLADFVLCQWQVITHLKIKNLSKK